MKNLKRLLSVLLACCMVTGLLPLSAYAADEIASGACGNSGDNLTWVLDDEGTLTISGTGAMADYSTGSSPWYSSRSNITAVVINDSVISIGNSAFENCTSLTRVTIPNSVTSIGDHAFQNCTSLTSVTIPDGVTSIGLDAFLRCSSLTSVTIGNSVTSIDFRAFMNCRLTRVTIPNSVTRIESGAFYFCEDLTSITIPNSVTSIGGDAFYYCTNLTDVYYSGTKSEWNTISIWSNNTCLTDATIHYNSTGPDDVPFEGGVAFLSDWNEDDGNVVFDSAVVSPYFLEEGFDSTGLSVMVGKYVLATMGETNTLEVANILAVESAVGTVTACGDQTLTIDGATYPVSEDLALGSYEDKQVLYHTYEGTVVAFSPVVESHGEIQAWDPDMGTLTIEGTAYATNFLTDLSFSKNIGNHLNEQYYFTTVTTGGYTVLLEIGSAYYPGGKLEDFNADVYHARWLSAGGAGTETVLELDTPSGILYDLLSEENMGTAADMWKSFELVFGTLDDVTTLKDFAVEPKDVYSALILNALEASVSYDVISSEYEDAYKMFKSFFSDFKTVMKTDVGIDLNNSEDFQNFYYMQGKDVDAILEDWASTWFKESYPNMSDINKSLGYISTAMQAVGNIEECVEYAASCYTLMNLGNSMETVLQCSYNKCKTVYGQSDNLTLAFKECLEMVNLSMDELDEQINKKTAIVIGTEGAEYIISDLLWGEVTDYISVACPELAILQITYKAMKTVSDQLFNTDDAVEQYLKLDYMTDIESLVDSIYRDLESDFNDALTVELAQTYLSSMEFSFALRDVDCETAVKYVDIVQTSLVGSLLELFGAENYEELKDAMKDIQTNYELQYEVAETNWIGSLEDDYPGSGLYEFYETLYESVHDVKLVKQITAACPVDVYVYDQSDNVVAYVSNGRVSCSVDDLMIALIGDIKVIRLYDGADYRIEYVGTDTGTMDVTIEEYDEAEEVVRTVNYYAVALADGQTYSLDTDDSTMNPYELMDSTDNTAIVYDYDSMDSGTAHSVSVISGTVIHDGEVYAETTAKAGETLEITAYVPDGYEFVRWEASSEAVVIANPASANTSMIMGDDDVKLTAVMKQTSTDGNPAAPSSPSTNADNDSDNFDFDENGEIGLTFTDVEAGAWYEDAVKYVVANSLMSGYGENRFGPNDDLSRAQLAQVLYNKEDRPAVTSGSVFTDVDASAWYADAVTWAAGQKIVAGYGNGKFGPDDDVTREQFATILYRYAGSPATSGTLDSFTDANSVSKYAVDALKWAVEKDIVTGKGNGILDPKGKATRAEVAAMLMRFIENVD